ncbi:MAG: nitrous oxide-stimulated promoter family protein [Propionibacteriaceae bacterium]|nr:nitrous oxide-stimulated promoter family protein [Propionibacteriaceae bacterium]
MLVKGSQKAKDTELTVRFTQWYCAHHHRDVARTELVSGGVEAGIYGKKAPILCADCARYANYAERRTETCRFDPKPFCSTCTAKCYKPEMTEYARKVMRYSGPRSLRSRFALRALQHILASRRHKGTD